MILSDFPSPQCSAFSLWWQHLLLWRQRLRAGTALADADDFDTGFLFARSDVTPVQKVIQMLEDMKDQGKKEMEAEQVQFGKFDQFCEMTLADKGRSISDAADKIETLEADIQQAISETERLTNEIAAHASDIESTTTEKTEATELREKERGEFQTTLQDYTESIDAIGRALKALKEEDKKTSFVQLTAAKSLKLMPSEAVDSIDAYLNANKPKPVEKPSLIMEGSESEKSEKPEPKTYEFQSGAAIQMLETLADKFVDERNKLEQEEQASRAEGDAVAASCTCYNLLFRCLRLTWSVERGSCSLF